MLFRLILFLFFFIPAIKSFSGEIKSGSVPNSIVYQGRVEKDNAPLNGLMHIIFRIYEYPSGGTPVWTSSEYLTEARAGIFSVTISSIPISIFSNGKTLYLEVEIEGEKLSPREPINSVIYSMVAKKLEDGAFVHFSSFTVGTNPNAIGPSGQRAIILDGGIYTDRICFTDNSCISTVGGSSAVNEVFSSTTVYLRSDSDNNGSGDIIFQTATTPKAIITNSGNMGIGTTTPSEKLVVNGSATITNNLIIGENLYLSGNFNNGIIRGINNEQISIGQSNDRIDFIINGSTQITVNNDRLGIGTPNPSEKLDVNGNIKAQDITANNLIVSNEIKNNTGNLIIQKTVLSNVGIGTDTPKEKLHVAGTIKADLGISAATATFTSDVNILGNLNVSNFGRTITLSSTTIYGTLDVKGGFTLNNDNIAALASTQTFTAQNTFLNQLTISSHVLINNFSRLAVGSQSFIYPMSTYLQIGDSNLTSSTATLYMSAGANSNGNIIFYRGSNKVASIKTSGNNLNITYGNSDIQKTYIDESHFKIYNSTVIISPSTDDLNPAIYVSGNSNVGIGTTNANHKLTVAGNIKLTGVGTGIIFNDGTILTSSGSLSVGAISNTGDAVIVADSDNNGYGSIVMKVKDNTAMAIDNTAKIGIGTLSPSDKLQVIGGDVVIGNTLNPYSQDGKEDLIVAGNIEVDGMLKQRSSIPVEFTSLYVSNDVFLSTASGYRTGIGTISPSEKLDVNGNIRATGNIKIEGLSASRIVATDGFKILSSSITADNLRSSVSGTTGTGNLVFNTVPSFTTGITVNGYGNFTGITASSGTFTATGQYSIQSSSGILISAGTVNLNNTARIKNSPEPLENQDVATKYYVDQIGGGASDVGAWVKTGNNLGTYNKLGSTNPKDVVFIRNNSTQFTMTASGVNFSVPILSGYSITASSGTFTATGQYSIQTSSGILISAGTVNLNNTTRIKNSPDPLENQDVATKYYVDQIGGGASDVGAWVKTGNSLGIYNKLGSTNSKDVIFIRDDITQFSMTASGVNFSVPILSGYSITASSGTFSSGIQVNSGKIVTPAFQMTTGASDGYFLVSDGAGNAIWKDATSAGLGDKVVGNEVLDSYDSSLTRTGSGTSLSPYKLKLNLSNPNTWTATQTFNKGITASTITVSGFSTAGFVKNDASGNLSGGNSISATDIPRSSLVNGTGISMTGTLTNRLVGSEGNVTINVAANVPTSVTNDTNVTGSITSNVLTLGWAGQLGLSRGGTGADLSGAADGPIKKSGSSLGVYAISLSTDVVGTLPALKGGTGISGAGGTANRILLTTNGSSWSAGQINLNSDQVTNTLPVSKGGTGSTSYTTNRPIIYNGTNLVSFNGFNGSFTVAKSTNPAAGCMQLNYQYGILTSTDSVSCP
ncbi:MAG: hypothetical protein K6357_04450 [Elusimicrobiota bacterium]